MTVQETLPLLNGKKKNSRYGNLNTWKKAIALFLCLSVGVIWIRVYTTSETAMDIDVLGKRKIVIPKDVKPLKNKYYEQFFTQMSAMVDDSVDPCDNFYKYACGGWMKNTELPDDKPRVDTSFFVVAKQNEKIIEMIMKEKPPVVSEFYGSCLNGKNISEPAVEWISVMLNYIQNTTDLHDLMEYAGQLYATTGAEAFFDLTVTADPLNTTVNILQIQQGGLTFPTKEYYTEKQKGDKYFNYFVSYVENLSQVESFQKNNVSKFSRNILNLEAEFARVSLSNADLRDPWATSHAMSIAEIEDKYPYIASYMKGLHRHLLTSDLPVVVTTPSFFAEQNKILAKYENDIRVLRSYLSFHLIDSVSNTLGEYFRQANHQFHGLIHGLAKSSPRKQFCMDTTTEYLGEYIGYNYMKKTFSNETAAEAKRLIKRIEMSMEKLLLKEKWLDEKTREMALDKLHNVYNLIGGPDSINEVPFKLRTDNFFENIRSIRAWKVSNNLNLIGKPVNRRRWDMFASTVNAYYDPTSNKIVFPAAILQAPFYSANLYPQVVDYARIGLVMGHELSHGFDDQGRNYDGTGTLTSWWTKPVSKKFLEKAKCLSNQYSSFKVKSRDGKSLIGYVNGNLTLGENIADNGGLKLSYKAYNYAKANNEHLNEADNYYIYDDAKLFFLSFAQGWCEKRSDHYSELSLAMDPHSPGKWRVNGPLMNSKDFAEAYSCPSGSRMNPGNKCIVW